MCLHAWLNVPASENYSLWSCCPNKIRSYFRTSCYPGRSITNTVATGKHHYTDCSKLRKIRAGSLRYRQTRLGSTFFSISPCLPLPALQYALQQTYPPLDIFIHRITASWLTGFSSTTNPTPAHHSREREIGMSIWLHLSPINQLSSDNGAEWSLSTH